VTLPVGLVVLGLCWLAPRLDRLLPVPGKMYLSLTTDVGLPLGNFVEYSRWSTNSRIDLLPVSPQSRFMYALGENAPRDGIPEQKLILQDGWAGTLLVNFSDHPEGLALVRASMYSAALQLFEQPRVLVIGMGGGIDVWAAALRDARYVKAIELNQQIIDIHEKVAPHFSRKLLSDPRIEFVNAEGRSALMRERERYDVIQMTGIDTWTALTSGAYVLAENYLYTREAVGRMVDLLADGGVVQIIRFSDDMEALRLASNIHAALVERDVGSEFEGSVAVLRTKDRLAATLVKKGAFDPGELATLETFAREAGIGVLYLPSRRSPEIVERFIRSEDKAGFVERFPRDISPTTDDRPYFFNFWKWSNPLRSAGEFAQVSSVSQGNPAFIVGQLLFSAALSAGLILVPLAVLGRGSKGGAFRGRFLVYFAGLGLGFIAIEIALIQKLTLFLGHPLYSVTVTLAGMLVFTGLGSWGTGRLPAAHAWMPWLPVLLGALVGGFLALSPWVIEHAIASPLPLRVGLALAMIAPMALALGAPFAHGIAALTRLDPSAVPWAWAVNACCTVVGSIGTVVLSMNLGFSAVLVIAVAIYAVGFAAVRKPLQMVASGDA
jgi:hypothetical protein